MNALIKEEDNKVTMVTVFQYTKLCCVHESWDIDQHIDIGPSICHVLSDIFGTFPHV